MGRNIEKARQNWQQALRSLYDGAPTNAFVSINATVAHLIASGSDLDDDETYELLGTNKATFDTSKAQAKAGHARQIFSFVARKSGVESDDLDYASMAEDLLASETAIDQHQKLFGVDQETFEMMTRSYRSAKAASF